MYGSLILSRNSSFRSQRILTMLIFKTVGILVIISTNVQAANCKSQGKIETAPAIIDGDLVKKSEWPWMVSIMVQHDSHTFNCGGTLIHRSWVLTAAHCLYMSDAGPLLPKEAFTVLIGAVDIENGRNEGFETKIQDYIENSGFIMQAVQKKNNDIALLKLIRPVPEKFRNTIKIGDIRTPQNGDRCIAMGWGCDHNGPNPVTTSRLFHVVLPVIPIEKCAKKFQELIKGDIKTKICAGYFNVSTGICSGDSGGPLICRQNQQWVLSGITSFTIEKSPAVFTRVSLYKSWIMGVIKKDKARTNLLLQKPHNLLGHYFHNHMINMPTQVFTFPYYNYVVYRRLIPFLHLKKRYTKHFKEP